MGVVDKAIEDGVSDCGVADYVMPVVDGNLACNQCGATVVALFNDF